MLEIGHNHSLCVTRKVEFGHYLDAENLGEVLLPNRYAPASLAIGDEVDVFIYHDSEGRTVATTEKPKAQVGQFAYLEAIANTDFGTFLDWGLAKDLLVPFGEQHVPMVVGKYYLVHIYISKADGRITASSKVDKFVADAFDDAAHRPYTPRQSVDLIIANSTELGFKAIINHQHWGLLYQNEVFERLSFGQSIKGYIKTVREDGRIDLSLEGGRVTRDAHAQKVLDYLHAHGGHVPVHDKSDPEQIKLLFGMSKKAFKKTLGGLYKQQLIVIETDGIRLIGA